MTTYPTLNSWLDEIENYSTRRERIPEGALPWIETAWELGRESTKSRTRVIAFSGAEADVLLRAMENKRLIVQDATAGKGGFPPPYVEDALYNMQQSLNYENTVTIRNYIDEFALKHLVLRSTEIPTIRNAVNTRCLSIKEGAMKRGILRAIERKLKAAGIEATFPEY